MKTTFVLFIVALALGTTPVWAQDSAAPDDASAAPQATEEVAAPAAQPADVWWGNRSISYGNYIKFDRITVAAAMPAAPAGPTVLDSIRFDNKKKAVLSPAARAIADDAVRMLRANSSATIQIELKSNSPRSANAVRSYLVENGIAESRISTVGAGETTLGSDTIVLPVVAD